MDEHPNVELVRRAMEFVAKRDDEGLLSIWSDDMRYVAIDSSGPPAEWSRDEFLDMMVVGHRTVPERTYETVDIRPIGSDLVVAHLRMDASGRTGEQVTGDYLAVFRVRNGLLVEGWEFVSPEVAEFLDHSWS
ncbi:MAG TPA: nuclear transport factor 2 family protein [Acidimicrobiales bacterium]|jgi:ketosteroid isomerase-like protein|nr:nuclear transport factor 2 family protein [Acidimicrobiales bacterium]